MNYAVILAGGSGTRFWPLSRKNLPKQFLRILGKQSLLEATVRRTLKIVSVKNTFLITNKIYLEEIKKQVKIFNIPKENIILEPEPRNTLPAIALCAQIINLKDQEANIVVLPSDHYIKDDASFKKTIYQALDLSSRKNLLCLIGVKPDRLRLGLGYIRAGSVLEKNAFLIESFHEKPTESTAKKLLKQKNVFWNAGIFCFKSKVILDEIRIHQHHLYRQIKDIKKIKKIWQKIKPISIDYGVIEKSNKLAMVTGKFSWCDLGSWDTLSDLLPKDKKNNTVLSICDFVGLDNNNISIYSDDNKKLIAAIGIKDTIIVDTPDALLVCRKEKSQKIRQLVKLLRRKRKKCV